MPCVVDLCSRESSEVPLTNYCTEEYSNNTGISLKLMMWTRKKLVLDYFINGTKEMF